MADIVDLIINGFKSKEYIVGEWLAKGEMLMVFAGRGVGKTYISLKLGHSIASGGNFLGYSTKQTRVVYFDGEMGNSAIARRMKTIDSTQSNSRGLEKGMFCVHSFEDCPMEQMWNLADFSHQKLYDQVIEKSKAEVIIIDNINTCHNLKGSTDSDMNAWIRIQTWAIKKRSEGKLIIFVHHAGKSGAQLGTSQRENILDLIIELRKSRVDSQLGFNGIEWHVSKVRDLPPDKLKDMYIEYNVGLDGMEIYYSNLKEKRHAQARKWALGGFTKAQVSERLNMPKWEVEQAIKEAMPEVEDKNFAEPVDYGFFEDDNKGVF